MTHMPSVEFDENRSERELLESVLDRNRDALLASVSGLTDTEARCSLVPSLTTPLSLIKHCAAAERIWFQRTLGALEVEQCDGYAVGDDESWRTTKTDTIAEIIAEYRRARAISDEIAAAYPLDHVAHHYRRGAATLRWIYVHMIEELAQHTGHAEILVGQIKAGMTSIPHRGDRIH